MQDANDNRFSSKNPSLAPKIDLQIAQELLMETFLSKLRIKFKEVMVAVSLQDWCFAFFFSYLQLLAKALSYSKIVVLKF